MTVATTQDGIREAAYQLHLIVVGAGLAGLAAAISTRLEGHRVTVLEKAPMLQEVGAGLQVTPNATRLFRHWGVYDELESKAAIPSYLAVRRYDGTQLLAYEDQFQEKMLHRWGAPFWDVHRVDLHTILVRRARALGIPVEVGCEVSDVDFGQAIVTSQDGRTFHGDVILGADGLWSRTRDLMLNRQISPKPTGDLAYRIVLDLKDIQDPELKELVSKPSVNFWIGPKSHVVGYSVRQGLTYNLVLLRPDDLPVGISRAAADVEEMRAAFKQWDPILSRLLACVNKVDKWRLMHLSPLVNWGHKEGKFVLAGDACHPMLPYLAQGANSSLEDGAVLGRLLGHVTGPNEIAPTLQLYEKVRKTRGEGIAKEALFQRASFHLEDGPSQQQRDKIFLDSLGKEPRAPFPSRWTCPRIQAWLYGYDALAEADNARQAQRQL
ncbi:FAD binding domain protein [Xylaria bambusicola]|uniref:FAD binding domain protein n=1 Tax=Xylaria bambusicola TaxID=326684 RepID=UPI0020074480|nr:FAD binding domain protein [Xylaria bambusicola]KAI0517081.1 FAD binding domain protein [Xylaria bambusicola]